MRASPRLSEGPQSDDCVDGKNYAPSWGGLFSSAHTLTLLSWDARQELTLATTQLRVSKNQGALVQALDSKLFLKDTHQKDPNLQKQPFGSLSRFAGCNHCEPPALVFSPGCKSM